MKSYLSIYLPQWSVNLLQRKLRCEDAANGLILTWRIRNITRVVRCCAIAKAAGVKEGQELALARTLMPSITVRELEPLRDYADLYELASWARRFCPFVGIDSELRKARLNGTLAEQNPLYTGLVLDMTGTERLHKGPQQVIQRITRAMRRAGIVCRIGWAPTIGAAWALARHGASDIAIVERKADLHSVLDALPCAALRISDDAVAWLQQLGIERIEQLSSLPRKALSVRFGPEILLRLDSALGAMEEAMEAIPWPVSWLIKRSFDIPIRRSEALQKAVSSLLERLVTRLQSSSKKARVFTVIFQGRSEDDSSSFEIVRDFSLFASTRNKRHIASVIGPLIEASRVPGGVTAIGVASRSVERSSALQKSFMDDDEVEQERAGELLNNFVVRFGRERVRRIVFKESYLPECSCGYRPIETAEKHATYHAVSRSPAFEASLEEDRPSTLFTEPEEIRAISLLPDKPPSWIRWNGRHLKVSRGIGPETICEEWWTGDLSVREYFKIQDESGRWLWVYRDRATRRWFVHGVWA